MKYTNIPIPMRLGWEPDPDRELRFMKRVVNLVILVLALISGAWTFEGAYLGNLRVGGQSFATVVSAGLLAIGVTAAIMTAWWVMMAVIPTLRSPGRIVAGLVLVLSLQGWMLGVSSLNNMVAQAAPAALTTHMESVAQDYADRVDTAVKASLSIAPFLGNLRGEAESRCAQAAAERDRGALTGSPGPGAVTAMLDLLCVQATTVAETLSAAVAEAETRAGTADDLLQQLDLDIHDHSRTIFERETAFLQGLARLEAWLRRSDASDLTRTLTVAHEAMAASIAPPSLTQGGFGARQQALIQDLRGSVDATGQVYRDMISGLPRQPVADHGPARISLIAAIWRSRIDHLPQIAAAIGIDLFQLFIVLAFLLAESGRRPQAARGEAARSVSSPVDSTPKSKGPTDA
ncbi:MAG: hypothetical protein AAF968_05240 [Pseudomonadota bacterium]